MYQKVSFHDFVQAFRAMGRGEQFNHDGLRALFDYLEEVESWDADKPVGNELDVVALCCEWVQYDDAWQAAAEYDAGFESTGDTEDDAQAALDWLRDQTTVLECDDGSIMLQQF